MRASRLVGLSVVGAFALSGCGGLLASVPPQTPSPTPTRTVQVGATFSTTGGTAWTYDTALVPAGSRAAVSATTGDDGTTVELAVRGLEPDRRYGAHVHENACGPSGDDAGPHFQHEVDPVQPSVDPAFANPENEIWLDLTTDGAGAATATATVAWGFERSRRAQSVVLHAMPTSSDPGSAGTAGDRAACVTVQF